MHAEGFHRPAERGNHLSEFPAKMGGEEGVLGIPAENALRDHGASGERTVGEGGKTKKKAGYLHSAFLEEFHGAVMKRRRAESVVHDFDAVGFPAKIVDDVGDDASQVVAHAAALDAGAEVGCGELDEVVVAQLVVVGNRHLQRGHRCVGVGGKILHGSEKLCLVATTVGKRREAMAGRSRREGKSSSGSLS